jgi:autotransporter-associated beta strand protein
VNAGTLVLSANNTYTGGTVIPGGVLRDSAGANLSGSSQIAGNVTMNDGMLNLRANQPQMETSGQLAFGSGASQLTTNNSAAGQTVSGLTLRGNATLATQQQLGVNLGTLTLDNTGGQAGALSERDSLVNGPTGRPQPANQPAGRPQPTTQAAGHDDYVNGTDGWQNAGTMGGWRTEGGQSTFGSTSGYVAGSTFSLPVSLPDGQVRLDFVRMGGDAEVTILAIPARLSSNLYATGTILVLLVVLAVLYRFIARRRTA